MSPMSQKSKLDLAYAAGIVDGEGCIGIYKQKNTELQFGYTYGLTVTVGMCSAAIPMWLYKTFGGNLNTHEGRKDHYKRVYNWQVAAREGKLFLELILPYLKEKTGQAKVAIEFQEIREGASQPNQYRHKTAAVLEAEGILAAKLKLLKT